MKEEIYTVCLKSSDKNLFFKGYYKGETETFLMFEELKKGLMYICKYNLIWMTPETTCENCKI